MTIGNLKYLILAISMILTINMLGGCASTSSSNAQSTKPQTSNIKIDGLFGAKWQMTKEQVLKNIGECRQTNADSYMQIRDYLGRRATVNYNFKNEKLWMIVVTFMESYDSANRNDVETIKRFNTTQGKLENQYGVFPIKEIKNEPMRTFSFIAADNIRIDHMINSKDQHLMENVIFYIWNGK